MSRSFKKTLAWGRSTEGNNNRCKTLYSDDTRKAQLKELGKHFIRTHRRATLQTEMDYYYYVAQDLFGDLSSLTDRGRREVKMLQTFLNGREPTDELLKEFAHNLYVKDRSR